MSSYSSGRRPSLTSNTDPARSPKFALRLLIAANCQNTTAQGLAEALEHFPNLAFLDLSRTLAARDQRVLARLGDLSLLQVLKLRGVHLRDEDIRFFAGTIGIRVRSLDVSENALTDHSVRVLLHHCFLPGPGDPGSVGDAERPSTSSLSLEDWPAGFVRPDSSVLDEFRDESYDERFVRRLTTQVVSRLPFEDMSHSGITHLYIAENSLSVEGLAALIRSKRLHVLDAGSIDTTKNINRPRSHSSASRARVYTQSLNLPGVEKLIPVLNRCGQEMTSLRIDRALVTEQAPLENESSPSAVCELPISNPAVEMVAEVPVTAELGAAPPVYELDSQEAVPRYELPGDPVRVVLSPAIGPKPQLSIEEQRLVAKRGSVFAPEVMEDDREAQENSNNNELGEVLTASGLNSSAQAVNGIPSQLVSLDGARVSMSDMSNSNTDLALSVVRDQRKELRNRQDCGRHGLLPSMLPALRTITLTSVPSHISSRNPLNAIISFIESCASEHYLAELEARLMDSSPHNKKARKTRRCSQNRHTASRIFALQKIILEMEPKQPTTSSRTKWSPPGSHGAQKTGVSPKYRTLSSTEDVDSEAFMSASRDDFTFFDNEEECGLPALERDSQSLSRLSLLTMTEKMTPTNSDSAHDWNKSPMSQQGQVHVASKSHYNDHHPHQPLSRPDAQIDLIHELTKYRRERKAAFERQMKMGGDRGHVDGYWPGEVKVIRPQSHPRLVHSSSAGAEDTAAEGKIDYYGNYSERGVYR